MRTARNLKQKMKYALAGAEIPVYELDEYGNILYYEDADGNKFPLETGDTKQGYHAPVDFEASINNKLDEVLVKEFGIDDSTNYSQIVTAKGYLPLKVGSLIWKKSEVKYEDEEKTIVDKTSSDYTVMGIADEGLNFDLFLLQRNV